MIQRFNCSYCVKHCMQLKYWELVEEKKTWTEPSEVMWAIPSHSAEILPLFFHSFQNSSPELLWSYVQGTGALGSNPDSWTVRVNGPSFTLATLILTGWSLVCTPLSSPTGRPAGKAGADTGCQHCNHAKAPGWLLEIYLHQPSFQEKSSINAKAQILSFTNCRISGKSHSLSEHHL